MNIKILQNSIRLQSEVKDILVTIINGKDNKLMRKYSLDWSTKKCPRLEDSKKDVPLNHKQAYQLKFWKYGGNHYCK